MSIESQVGKSVYDLRDFLKSQLITVLIERSEELGLSMEQIKAMRIIVDATVDSSVDKGMNNILSTLNAAVEKSKAEEKEKKKKKRIG